VQQGVDGAVASNVGITAVAPITTVGATPWPKLFAQEADATIAAIPRFNIKSNCIYHRPIVEYITAIIKVFTGG
jgi:hypothetical protein